MERTLTKLEWTVDLPGGHPSHPGQRIWCGKGGSSAGCSVRMGDGGL